MPGTPENTPACLPVCVSSGARDPERFVSAPRCHIGREGEWLSQRNPGSRAALSRVRSVLSMDNNPVVERKESEDPEESAKTTPADMS